MESRKYFRIKPKRIILPDGTCVSYRRFINGVLFEGEAPTPPIVVDPILDNNSWAVIAQVCDQGKAADYWSLGDVKTDVGTDGVTRTFRICDMSGMYGKNAVFEQVELEANGIAWNASTNTDDDGAYNNYNISDMRSTVLPALLAKYSSELQAVITNTTYKVAKNGWASPMPILDLSDKLFLPAERELFASRAQSVQDEWNALTRFALYALAENDNATFRTKKDPTNTAQRWWERSPRSGNTSGVCYVNNGNANYSNAFQEYYFAPVFALGVAPITTTESMGGGSND